MGIVAQEQRQFEQAEQYYQNAMIYGCSLTSTSFCEQKLSTVQRRYLRVIETLARERKLMGFSMVQINIATEGGQQIVNNA